jgi:5'-phosphate synthase pdxT subunit
VRVGVLSLQGDVADHVRLLRRVGVEPVLVRRPHDLDGVAGLVLPGGESTTMTMLVDSSGLRSDLVQAAADGLPMFGTCAGMILLARQVLDGRADQWTLGSIDVVVRRNAYGRQVQSFEVDLPVPWLGEDPVRAVFIRAPQVVEIGAGVEVLATLPVSSGGGVAAEQVVLCRQGPVVASAFHPELTDDDRLHRWFVEQVIAGGTAVLHGPERQASGACPVTQGA